MPFIEGCGLTTVGMEWLATKHLPEWPWPYTSEYMFDGANGSGNRSGATKVSPRHQPSVGI